MSFPQDLLLKDIRQDVIRQKLLARLSQQASDSIGETMFCNDAKSLKYQDFLESLIVDKTVDKKWINYLPLELMKTKPWLDLWQKARPYRQFRSSGTSQQVRSLSPFSEEGLNLYRNAALCDFYKVLETLLPDQHDLFSVPGISLIPTIKDWPDSSLAYMIDAFSKHWPVRYLNLDEVAASFEKKQGQTTWIFGTALHYINLFEKFPEISHLLPKNLLLFETGGSKSSWRRWSHPDFIKWLRDRLPHQEQRIISEYGMCELACQAYGIWQGDATIRMHFANDVQVQIQLPGGRLAREGVGALMIKDPLRIDLPFPMRTQDIVKLHADGSFEIQERVPQAVLKGCSLRVSDLPSNDMHTITQKDSELHSTAFNREEKFQSLDSLSQFLSSEIAIHALQLETAMPKQWVARELNALKNTLPATIADRQRWLQTAYSSVQTWSQTQNKTGLFLAPKNHSLALIEAISAALCLGDQVLVRLPSTIGHTENNQSLLAALIVYLQKQGSNIQRAPDHLRIGNDLPFNISYVYLHGEDETIAKLKSLINTPIFGFGSAFTLLATRPEELLNNSKQITAAMMHLGQWGCESLRAVLCRIPDEGFEIKRFMELVSRKFRSDFQDALDVSLPVKWQLSLDHARLHLMRNGFHFADVEEFYRGPLLPYLELSHLENLNQSFMPYLYSLPILFYKDSLGEPKHRVHHLHAYIHWLTNNDLNQKKNPEIWTGLHQNLPLFHLQGEGKPA